MITISLCMIVKNEEEVLARCLHSVEEAMDEIIIVDTGSSDRTKEIARTFTDKVIDFTWIDDFSAARNTAYGQATMDYQMWLDADDVMPAKELEKLLKLKQTLDPAVEMVTMRYNTHFDENGIPVLTSRRERLTRRDKGYRWQDPVHECIPLSGHVIDTDITIDHRKIKKEETSDRNLRIYQALAESGRPMTPRQTYYYARELKDHAMFCEAAKKFEEFLDGGLGWVEDNIAACFELARCLNAMKQPKQAFEALRRSFEFGEPRAEILSEIGYYYKRMGRFADAAGWFRAAASLDEPRQIGFLLRDYWGFIPNIELCVCCYNLGDMKKAREYNERAAVYKPDSPAVIANQEFFAKLEAEGA